MDATQTETLQSEALGPDGGPCEACGNPLASDQRYCLECGSRRGPARLPLRAAMGASARPAEPLPPAAGQTPGLAKEWTPLTAVGLVAVIALILVAGVLIGRDGGDQAPQIVTVGEGDGAATSVSADGDQAAGRFKSDWPSGKEGFTLELGVLKKSGTTAAQVATAKEDAEGKGAPKVGALDSDAYPSLPAGNYVIYSGVFDTKAAASKALRGLKKDFPDVQVIRVSKQERSRAANAGGGSGGGRAAEAPVQVDRQQLDELDNLGGEEYVKRSKKLPDTTGLGGKPPPKDNAAPGAGGEALEIK